MAKTITWTDKAGRKHKRVLKSKKRSKTERQKVFGAVNANNVVIYAPKAVPFSPDKMTKYFTYNYESTGAHTSGTDNSFGVVLNGMYDPDINDVLGNGQPLGMDQYLGTSGMYRYYSVKGFKTSIRVTLLTQVPDPLIAGLTEHGALEVLASPMRFPGMFTEIDTLAEAKVFPGTKQKFLVRQGDSVTFTTSSSWDALRKQQGRDDTDRPWSAYGSNPTDQCQQYFHISDAVARFDISGTYTVKYLVEYKQVYEVELSKLDPQDS